MCPTTLPCNAFGPEGNWINKHEESESAKQTQPYICLVLLLRPFALFIGMPCITLFKSIHCCSLIIQHQCHLSLYYSFLTKKEPLPQPGFAQETAYQPCIAWSRLQNIVSCSWERSRVHHGWRGSPADSCRLLFWREVGYSEVWTKEQQQRTTTVAALHLFHEIFTAPSRLGCGMWTAT